MSTNDTLSSITSSSSSSSSTLIARNTTTSSSTSNSPSPNKTKLSSLSPSSFQFDSDSQKKRRSGSSSCSSMTSSNTTMATVFQKIQRLLIHQWKGNMEFVYAQAQVVVILGIAYIGNNWKYTYPRNMNQNYSLFWMMNLFILMVGLYTMKHTPNTRNTLQILSRSQTEEWKGWMQWAFIMYHYYRAANVYNIIRVFVSSYVWMTGFGNFLYFDKKQDFSIERAISMWLRINYFPLLLSIFVGVPFDLLYIVPLHTTAFFITMITCYVAKLCETYLHMNHWQKNCTAMSLCAFVHVMFYETPCAQLLEYLFGHEIYFRFTSDKYSAVLGIISGYFWHHAQSFVTWANTPMVSSVTTTASTNHNHNSSSLPTSEATSESNSSSGPVSSPALLTQEQQMARYGQIILGIILIVLWWMLFGHIDDKFVYNPIHPFVFWFPLFGWLMIRNSSKYLTEIHSTALEFFGKITLETYVLQFHVFMCRNVQHIPIVLPNSGPDGNPIMKFLNMLLTGIGFVALAYWARKITVTTQTTVTDLVVLLLDRGGTTGHTTNNNVVEITSVTEKVPLTAVPTIDDIESKGVGISDNGDHLK